MNLLKKIIGKYGNLVCSFALAGSNLTTNYCRCFLYEPEEPKGLEEFKKHVD
jgi:cyclic lactone autoinducer peptide